MLDFNLNNIKILKKNGIAIINSDLPETKKILNLCKKKKN